MEKVIVVAGPTAAGKTALAIGLAQRLGGEIVSADSMQIYRRMDIGTAKPTEKEQQKARHHMIDVICPGEEYSVSLYAGQAARCVEDILRRGKRVIICGGTGLYIEALLRGTDFGPGGQSTDLRRRLMEEWEKDPQALWQELMRVDPEKSRKLHPQDQKRVVRALEVFRQTGKPLSYFEEQSRLAPPRYQALWLGVRPKERSTLYERINQRVTKMLEEGLLQETQSLWEEGLLQGTALQAIAYKEMLGFLRGECSLTESAELLRRKSRNYAKRQLTYFNHVEGLRWLEYEKPEDFPALVQIATDLALSWL